MLSLACISSLTAHGASFFHEDERLNDDLINQEYKNANKRSFQVNGDISDDSYNENVNKEKLEKIEEIEHMIEDSSKIVAALLKKYEKISHSDDNLVSHSRLQSLKRDYKLNEYLQKKRGYYTRPCLMNVISCYYHGK